LADLGSLARLMRKDPRSAQSRPCELVALHGPDRLPPVGGLRIHCGKSPCDKSARQRSPKSNPITSDSGRFRKEWPRRATQKFPRPIRLRPRDHSQRPTHSRSVFSNRAKCESVARYWRRLLPRVQIVVAKAADPRRYTGAGRNRALPSLAFGSRS
jgi:hypothetical protein